MESVNPYDDLEKEKIELLRLVDDTLKQGIPIIHNEMILEQSRKVDSLIVKTQIPKGKTE